MNLEGNLVKIKIYGTEYPIRGDSDAEYIEEIAQYVDQKMREIDRKTHSGSSLKVAILAALNIVDELFRCRSENQLLEEEFSAKMEHLTDLLAAKRSDDNK